MPPKSLHNKYSVLCIEQTDDVENDNNHKKRVEIISKPISPTKILKRGETLSKEAPTRAAGLDKEQTSGKGAPTRAASPDKKVESH